MYLVQLYLHLGLQCFRNNYSFCIDHLHYRSYNQAFLNF